MRITRLSILGLLSLTLGACNAILGNATHDVSDDGGNSTFPGDASVSARDGGSADPGVQADAGEDATGRRDGAAEGGAVVASDGSTCDPNDVHSCGSCTHDCTELAYVDETGLACSADRCLYSCAAGHGDCSDAGAGCTTDLSGTTNCGGCGVICSGATPFCAPVDGGAHACASGCGAGQTNCSGTCTNLSTDPAHCGSCDDPCASGETCVSGVCACGAGQTLCNGVCVNLTGDDPANCGACGRSCAALTHVSATGASCSAGRCSYECAAGFADCTDAGAGCATVATSTTNCGGCGVTCGPAAPVCSASDAGTASCVTGCPAGQSNCSGACSVLATDPNNCGMCGAQCLASETCTGGKCACPASETLCASACVNTQTDNDNCGTCGDKCPAAASCQSGVCACPPGTPKLSLCGTTCVNEQTDGNNCGACGKACGAGTSCQGGKCIMTCSAPTPNLCGSTCVDTQTDPNNCGTCGATCAIGCVNGSCLTVRKLAAGTNASTCALLSDGTIRCWGLQAKGVLGDGMDTGAAVSTPRPVAGISGATDLALGLNHGCAVSGGDVSCWGTNPTGELGVGAACAPPGPCLPAAVAGVSGVQAIYAAGDPFDASDFSCALMGGGQVSCWGDNFEGELANGVVGGTANSPTLTLLSGVTSLALFNREGCAATSMGTVSCWGDNQAAFLGIGVTGSVATPTEVGGIASSSGVAVFGGDFTMCILLKSPGGLVTCSGQNALATSGGTTTLNTQGLSTLPQFTGANVSSIAMNAGDCALLQNGTVQCWGTNLGGTASTASPLLAPAAMTGLAGVTQLVAGGGSGYACALLSNGTVECWGQNNLGQLGLGSTSAGSVPPTLVKWR